MSDQLQPPEKYGSLLDLNLQRDDESAVSALSDDERRRHGLLPRGIDDNPHAVDLLAIGRIRGRADSEPQIEFSFRHIGRKALDALGNVFDRKNSENPSDD